jgi:hypothetical protein
MYLNGMRCFMYNSLLDMAKIFSLLLNLKDIKNILLITPELFELSAMVGGETRLTKKKHTHTKLNKFY